MICPSCGYDPGAAATCPRCGATLAAPAAEGSLRPAGPEASPWAPPEDPSAEPTVALPGHEPTLVMAHSGPGGTPTGPEPIVPVPGATLGDAGAAPGPQQDDGAASPAVDQAPTESPRKRRLWPVLLVAVAVLVAGAGVATAGVLLGWFGGGKRPADVLPASTLAYVQLDLDPSLAQKAQAWQFLRDLPEVKDAVASGQPDPKRIAWDLLNMDEQLASGDDYDADVKPWLGDRFAVGVLKRGDEAVWVSAVQVSDEANGAAKLREWIAESKQDYDVSLREGFALLTMTKDTSYVLAELAQGTLTQNQQFTADFATLGDPGVLAGWADLAGLASISQATGSVPADAVQGRGVFAVGFSADTLRVDGKLFGLDSSVQAAGAGDLGNVPLSTGAAISIWGGGAAVAQSWPWLGEEADSWLQEYGLERADVAALLGRSLTLSVPTSALEGSDSEQVAMGLRVISDDVARAQAALHKIVGGFGVTDLADRVDGDVLTAATTPDYLDELVGSSARLSSSEAFLKAVPDHAKATSAIYVALAPIIVEWTSSGSPYATFVGALRAVGAEFVIEEPGNGSWSVRLVRS